MPLCSCILSAAGHVGQCRVDFCLISAFCLRFCASQTGPATPAHMLVLHVYCKARWGLAAFCLLLCCIQKRVAVPVKVAAGGHVGQGQVGCCCW